MLNNENGKFDKFGKLKLKSIKIMFGKDFEINDIIKQVRYAYLMLHEYNRINEDLVVSLANSLYNKLGNSTLNMYVDKRSFEEARNEM